MNEYEFTIVSSVRLIFLFLYVAIWRFYSFYQNQRPTIKNSWPLVLVKTVKSQQRSEVRKNSLLTVFRFAHLSLLQIFLRTQISESVHFIFQYLRIPSYFPLRVRDNYTIYQNNLT